MSQSATIGEREKEREREEEGERERKERDMSRQYKEGGIEAVTARGSSA